MERISENISDEQGCSEQFREEIDILRSRLFILDREDKLLMTMYLENGNSFRQIANLTRTNQSNISRKIRRIKKRLLDGKYILCLQHRVKFNPFEMAVAKDYYANGLSLMAISQNKDISYSRLRKMLARIKGIIEEENNQKQHLKSHTRYERPDL